MWGEDILLTIDLLLPKSHWLPNSTDLYKAVLPKGRVSIVDQINLRSNPGRESPRQPWWWKCQSELLNGQRADPTKIQQKYPFAEKLLNGRQSIFSRKFPRENVKWFRAVLIPQHKFQTLGGRGPPTPMTLQLCRSTKDLSKLENGKHVFLPPLARFLDALASLKPH